MSLDDYLINYSDPKQVYQLPEVQEKLLSAKCKILLILLDFRPHSSKELMRRTGATRIAARIHELRKKHGLIIDSWADELEPTLWWYQLKTPLPYKDPFAVICRERLEEWWGRI